MSAQTCADRCLLDLNLTLFHYLLLLYLSSSSSPHPPLLILLSSSSLTHCIDDASDEDEAEDEDEESEESEEEVKPKKRVEVGNPFDFMWFILFCFILIYIDERAH